MELHLIDDSLFAAKKRNLSFLFDAAGNPVGLGWLDSLEARKDPNEIQCLIDSLYDGDGPIYADQDGSLYGAELVFDDEQGLVPGVWQRLV